MLNTRLTVIAAGALALCGAVSPAEIDSGEIVWRTYDRVIYPGDMELSCSGVKAQIAHVDHDVDLMDRSRRRAEEAMRTGGDLVRYLGAGKGGGAPHATPGNTDIGIYAKARSDIVASRRVALDRRNHLENLLLFCKP